MSASIAKNDETTNQFLRFSHRGYGYKTYARYQQDKSLQYVHNYITGLELGVELGADALELDLSKTTDGKIVTAHGNPFQNYLHYTQEEYLFRFPETLTFNELLDWLYHQDKKIMLYLELKSSIHIKEIIDYINEFVEQQEKQERDTIRKMMYEQVMVYSHKLSYIENLIAEKDTLGLKTNDIKVWWVSLPLIITSTINKIKKIGNKTCGIYGIEQGMLPWGTGIFLSILDSPFSFLPPITNIKRYFSSLVQIVSYAHEQNLQYIIGTIDNPKWVQFFMKQGVNGVVPNSPSVFFFISSKAHDIHDLDSKQEKLNGYIPLSMKKRLFRS